MSSTEEEEDKSVINENGETPSIIETTNKNDNSKKWSTFEVENGQL